MRLGLCGGTFDPIHHGHLDVARAAHHHLSLDVVWIMPSRQPPHRTAPGASAAHRFAMAALAVQEQPGLVVSDIEMNGDGATYTTDTLDRVEALGFDMASVFFVMGADAFRDIGIWRNFPRVLDRCHFAVVSRPGLSAADVVSTIPEARGRLRRLDASEPGSGIFLIDVETAAVSSTDVRNALRQGAPIDGMVPRAVAAHIARHGLYAPATAVDNDRRELHE